MNLDIGKLEDVERLVENIVRTSEPLHEAARTNARVSAQLLDAAKNLKSTIRIMEETMQALATSEERLAEGVARSLLRVLERAIQIKERMDELEGGWPDGRSRGSERQRDFGDIWGEK